MFRYDVNEKSSIQFFILILHDITPNKYINLNNKLIMFQYILEFFNYGYEFMGSNKNTVITPLTNRVFLTFTQAFMMCLGGATHGKTFLSMKSVIIKVRLIVDNY